MTVAQYCELAAYWQKHPPTHLLLGTVFGYKEHEATIGDLGNLLVEVGAGGLFASR